MKYVIANCGHTNTNVFMYETDNSEELFRFVRMNNELINGDAPEIEVYEYHKNLDDDRILKLANFVGRIPTLEDMWNHEALGKLILSKYNDDTNKINVLSEGE